MTSVEAASSRNGEQEMKRNLQLKQQPVQVDESDAIAKCQEEKGKLTKKERSNQAKALAVKREEEGLELQEAGLVAQATTEQTQAIITAAVGCIPGTIPMVGYFSQKTKLWPRVGKMVLGCVDRKKDTILCYQAYRPEIARPAAKHNDFVTENPHFSPTRMTWTKTSFLWMMYRCGWCTKKDQEHCLMIEVKLSWFLQSLLPSTALANSQGHSKGRARSTSVVQWDPDHTPNYGSVARRAIQIGMRGQQASEWAQGVKGPAIVAIHDITDFVKTCRPTAQGHQDFPMPEEKVLDDAVFPHLCCPSLESEEEIAPGFVVKGVRRQNEERNNAAKAAAMVKRMATKEAKAAGIEKQDATPTKSSAGMSSSQEEEVRGVAE